MIVTLILVFCAQTADVCRTVEVAEHPASLAECVQQGQVKGAEFLAEFPMIARDYRLDHWLCRVGQPQSAT